MLNESAYNMLFQSSITLALSSSNDALSADGPAITVKFHVTEVFVLFESSQQVTFQKLAPSGRPGTEIFMVWSRGLLTFWASTLPLTVTLHEAFVSTLSLAVQLKTAVLTVMLSSLTGSLSVIAGEVTSGVSSNVTKPSPFR